MQLVAEEATYLFHEYWKLIFKNVKLNFHYDEFEFW